MSKDFFDGIDPNTCTYFGDIMVYDNQYVEPLESDLNKAKLEIADNESRITAIEHQIPGGGGGTGAYLNLGGTPSRYPLASECVGTGAGDESGFMVVARPDGIYFYNPTTKQLIEPKKGGGTVALQGQLPDVYGDEHKLMHTGRATKSGVYLADYDTIGITEWTGTDRLCTVLVVSSEKEEQQTAFSAEGTAHRVFPEGVHTGVDWVHEQSGLDDATRAEIDQIKLDVADHETRIDSLEALPAGVTDDELKTALSGGNYLVNPSGIGQSLGLTSKDWNQASVASKSHVFTIGSSVTKVTLPDIVSSTTNPIPANSVREGRTTYIINHGIGNRTVEVAAGHNFYINGSTTTDNQIVEGKSVKVYTPGIFGNGTKCWLYMGCYDLKESLGSSGAGDAMVASINEGAYFEKPLGRIFPAAVSTGNLTANWVTTYPMCHLNSGSTRNITLPEIVGGTTASPTSVQIRSGRFVVFNNHGNGHFNMNLFDGQFFKINGVNVTTPRTVPPRTLELWFTGGSGAAAYWMPVFSTSTEDPTVTSWKAADRTFLTGLTTGDTAINGKSWGRPTTMITGDVATADQWSLGGNLIINSATTCTVTAPKIVGVTQTTLASNEVRLGTEIAIYNHGNQDVNVNFIDSKRWNKGVESNTGEVKQGRYKRYLATHISGSNYCWVLLTSGVTGE